MKQEQVTPRRARPIQTRFTKLVTTKIVTVRPPSTDPRALERERFLAALLAAQGRTAITQAADAFFAAGHALPEAQEPLLQLLEHVDEARVRDAIAGLEALLAREPIRRRPVLEQRLVRIEDNADEPSTRAAAATLRRKL